MAFFVSGAIIGSAVLGAGASIYAANKQEQSANNALNFQKQAYNDTQPRFDAAANAFKNAQGVADSSYAPYLDIGRNATYTLGQLTGTGTAGGRPDYSSFFTDPSYTFAQQQGELGIERGANARGLNLSGGTLKDLATFNSGLASQQYGNYFNRLMGLSQLGAGSATNYANTTKDIASGMGNLATGQANSNNTAAANIGNTTQAVGQAQASGAVGVANAVNGGVGNSLMYNYLNRNPSAYGTSEAYGGGGAWGGSSANPLPGLSPSDYGAGF